MDSSQRSLVTRENVRLKRLIMWNSLAEAHLSLSLLLCALNRKIIEVKIIDDEEYEKNKAFTIELGEPVLLEIGQKHGGCLGLNLYSMTLRNHLSANRARLSLIA